MLIIVSAPSGGGKTTIIKKLFNSIDNLSFSVSATTRGKRNYEKEGIDYYFLTKDEFVSAIKKNQFAEWEVVHDNYYGTFKKEIENKTNSKKDLIFDVDVKGALNLKKLYPDALMIFINSPLEQIKERLKKRSTETVDQIQIRINRIETEMKLMDKFDYIVLNEDGEKGLESATKEIIKIINKHRGNFKNDN